MHRLAAWLRAVAAVFWLAVFSANPACAQSASDLDSRAAAEYNRGLDARDAGRNGAACQHFRNAGALYHNSITALTGYPMRTEEQRDQVKQMANQQQSSLNGAKAKAAEVCGRPDGPALSRSSSGSAAVVDDDHYAEKKELKRLGDLAHSQYKESVRLWEAGDRAGACAAIRLSTAAFEKVSLAIKADPALARGVFVNPDQVLANGQMAAEVRDEDFCKV
ncbi:MAG: hypothetical protein ABL912_10015 [Novosphingobium sp.]